MTGSLLIALPPDAEGLADAEWEDIERWYGALATTPLDDGGAIEVWLASWSRLEELVTEAASLAMIAYASDTENSAKEAAHLRWSTGILPRAEEQSIAMARRLVDSGYERADLAYTLARFRTSIDIFREANVPLFAELEELAAQYQRTTGGMTAEWRGERLPLPRLTPFLQSGDRSVRETAWRAVTAPYVSARDGMAELFDRMLDRRQRAAANAGFASFRDYVFPAKFRFDYSPADCERFHDAIRETVVPAVERLHAERRDRLRLPAVRPWDLGANPYRDEPLAPYRDPAVLARTARRIFARVDPGLGEDFQVMIDERLLDLESRRGKAPGGFCDTLHARGRPFIFMNASGVMDDVNTLLHEAGHCFHAFASDAQPLIWQRQPGAESAELASMAMELLAGPHLGPPEGYLSESDAAIARLEHLEDTLTSLAHIASIDAFQHWIYTTPDARDSHARDQAWLSIRGDFERGVDWSGLEVERIARWYRQLHIFLYPFYYIEYGIAQVGALQIWRNSLEDPGEAVRQYRDFLSLGATRPLPELYAAAGIRLAFDRRTLAELVGHVEETLATLRARVPSRGPG